MSVGASLKGTRRLLPRALLQSVWPAAVIVLAALWAYRGTYRDPFVFDDLPSISENASIRALWPPWAPLAPPSHGTTVGGRPLANVTLALNYALSGTDPWSYHAVNVLIHILASLALFGLIRRTLGLPLLGGRFARDATPLACAAALVWCLHPLQTEAVTYIIQRVESLMVLFYLLTLYLFVRSVEEPEKARWRVGMVGACLLGMATKEVMATAPCLVLLYDRTFLAGSFGAPFGCAAGSMCRWP